MWKSAFLNACVSFIFNVKAFQISQDQAVWSGLTLSEHVCECVGVWWGIKREQWSSNSSCGCVSESGTGQVRDWLRSALWLMVLRGRAGQRQEEMMRGGWLCGWRGRWVDFDWWECVFHFALCMKCLPLSNYGQITLLPQIKSRTAFQCEVLVQNRFY